jgi:hypothetical protein
MQRNHTRYQVLFKAHAPKTGVEYVNCATLPEARRVAARLRKAGEAEVQIWDTLHNPLSDLFSI